MRGKIVILMGSRVDWDFSSKIAKHLEDLGIEYECRIASAHKTPQKVLNILKEYENEKIVYVIVAGRSNALSAFVDANTTKPVIACPPYSEKFGGADIYSSLRIPSGIGSLVTIEPEGAAIAAAKILALENKGLAEKVSELQARKKKEIDSADEAIRGKKIT